MNQLAFKDPDQALSQFNFYVDDIASKRTGWTAPRVAAIKQTADDAYNDSVSIFRGSQTETDMFWAQLRDTMADTINEATNNTPSEMERINGFMATIGAGAIAADAETQTSGLNLVGNLLQEQAEEIAKESKETKKKFDKWLPLGILAFGIVLALRIGK